MAVVLPHFLHVLFPQWLAGICLTLPTLSLYLSLDFPHGFTLESHWSKLLYSLTVKGNTHTEEHPTSAPVSLRPSMTTSFICIFNFGLCSFIEVCQNTHFMVSPEFFVLSSIAVLLSRAVWFLTIGISFLIDLGGSFIYDGRK